MNFGKRVLAITAVAAGLTVGTVGLVAAAGVQGHGPASVLSELVTDGTLTQEQADKVTDAFEKQREEMKAKHEEQRAAMEAVVTDTLGISKEDLEAAREEGKSLADIAGDKRDELVAALVAFQTAEIDAAVADGKMTQEQADKMKADLPERVAERVDNAAPEGRGPGGHGGPGRGGPDGGPMGSGFGGPPPGAGEGEESGDNDDSAGA